VLAFIKARDLGEMHGCALLGDIQGLQEPHKGADLIGRVAEPIRPDDLIKEVLRLYFKVRDFPQPY
jgi:hypothetical protein